MISIIIPTLNEQEYLPRLLKSIKDQDFSDYEIIVADAGSKDNTLLIASEYGAKITPGGLPAKGRNEGAKIARGDVLFFLDADTILPKHFLKKSMEEFRTRNLDFASYCLKAYPFSKLHDFFLDTFYNKMMLKLEHILAHGAVGILCKKDLFEKLHGYDESIRLAEDHDFARRAAKIANFGLLRSTKLLVSDRRWRQDGWLNVTAKYFLCELHTVFIGPVKSDIFKYKFNHYKKKF